MTYKRIILATILSVLIPSIASAVVTIHVESMSLPTPGAATTGFVDIFVEVVPLGSGPQISGWDLELGLTGSSSGVTFTGVEVPSGLHPNVFPGETPFAIVSPTMVQATNMLMSGTTELIDQAGFLRVNFSIAAGTAGIFKVQVLPGIFTNLVGAAANPNPIDFVISSSNSEGSIVIGNVLTAVPEPNMVMYSLLALFVLGIRCLRVCGTCFTS